MDGWRVENLRHRQLNLVCKCLLPGSVAEVMADNNVQFSILNWSRPQASYIDIVIFICKS